LLFILHDCSTNNRSTDYPKPKLTKNERLTSRPQEGWGGGDVTDLTLKKTTTNTFIKTGQRKRHLLLKINRNATRVGAYFRACLFLRFKNAFDKI